VFSYSVKAPEPHLLRKTGEQQVHQHQQYYNIAELHSKKDNLFIFILGKFAAGLISYLWDKRKVGWSLKFFLAEIKLDVIYKEKMRLH